MNVTHRRTTRRPIDPPGSTIPTIKQQQKSKQYNGRREPPPLPSRRRNFTLWPTNFTTNQPRSRRRKKIKDIYYVVGFCALFFIALIEIKVLYQLIIGNSNSSPSQRWKSSKEGGAREPQTSDGEKKYGDHNYKVRKTDEDAATRRRNKNAQVLRRRSIGEGQHENAVATPMTIVRGNNTNYKYGKDSVHPKKKGALRKNNFIHDQHHEHQVGSNTTELFPNKHGKNHTDAKDAVQEKEIIKRWTIQNRRNYTERETVQRILFLVGPHKTGSSTFQTIAAHITNALGGKDDGKGWAMSDPWPGAERKFDVIRLGNAKHFAALIFPLIGQESHPLFVNPPLDPQTMIDLFQSDIYAKWNSDKKLNIILGSEEVDQILHDHLNGDEVLDNILSILPPNTQNVTEVVVTYRSPKSKHLISLWKEVGVQMWNETLKEFIFNPESFNHIHTIEPLGLSSMFLKRGFKVILVDIGGLRKHEVEGFQLVGCDLMKETCDNEGIMDDLKPALERYPNLMGELKKSVNVRTDGIIDLDGDQMDKIEAAMQQYDCSFKDSLYAHGNLTILYDANFVANMDACDGNTEDRIENRRLLWNTIKMIADPQRASEERKKRGRWTWVAPPSIKDYFQLTEPAYLASLMFAISGQTAHPLFTKKVTKELIYDIFKEDITQRFHSEKNILLGSEELDRLSSEYFNGEEMLSELMSLLKPDEKSVLSYYEITVVIGYNSPRIDQLLSLWNEVAKPSGKRLYDFTRDPMSIRHLHTIDPLFLADMFLNKSRVKVILIDIAGKRKARLEMYQTLACDIMLEACDSNHDPLFMEEHRKIHPDIMKAISIDPINTTEKKEALRLSTNLPKKQLDEIDSLLIRYDCHYRQKILGHENLTVLYDTTFTANMEKCDNFSSRIKLSREETWTVISSWADPDHDFKASLRAALYKN